MPRISRLLMLSVLIAAGCGLDLPNAYPLSSYSRKQLLGEAAGGNAEDPVYLPEPVATAIDDILYNEFGGPREPYMKSMSQEEADNVHAGALLYQQHCVHCHGVAGAGDGPTAAFLYPRPRDYRRGTFKWKSTDGKRRPTYDDLRRVLRNGALGSSMPPFRLMPAEDLDRLVDYVIFLGKRGELERRLLIHYATEGPPDPVAAFKSKLREGKAPDASIARAAELFYAKGVNDNSMARALSILTQQEAMPRVEVEKALAELKADATSAEAEIREAITAIKEEIAPEALTDVNNEWREADRFVRNPDASMPEYVADSKESDEALERGKKLYLSEKAACYKCHNADGRADPSMIAASELKKMVDDWGYPNYPRNLTLNMYRGGRRPIDLYRRIHQGIAGASMPEGGKNLKTDEIWDIVHFVRTLPYRPDLLPPPAPATASAAH